jgi:hypothetical protein
MDKNIFSKWFWNLFSKNNKESDFDKRWSFILKYKIDTKENYDEIKQLYDFRRSLYQSIVEAQ